METKLTNIGKLILQAFLIWEDIFVVINPIFAPFANCWTFNIISRWPCSLYKVNYTSLHLIVWSFFNSTKSSFIVPFLKIAKTASKLSCRSKKGSFGISSTWKVEKKAAGTWKNPAKLSFEFVCKLLECFTKVICKSFLSSITDSFLVLNVWLLLIVV